LTVHGKLLKDIKGMLTYREFLMAFESFFSCFYHICFWLWT
jgi:hypothetical protein